MGKYWVTNFIRKVAKKLNIEHWHVIALILIVYDAITSMGAYFLALMIRYDFRYSWIDEQYLNAYLKFAPFIAIITIFCYAASKMYRSIWRFASFSELLRTMQGVLASSIVHMCILELCIQRMPLSYSVFGVVLQFVFAIGIRFSYRFVLLLRHQAQARYDVSKKRVMIIGAGAAGTSLLMDIARSDEYKIKVCCFIDDNPNKIGRYMSGIKVVGTRDDILLNVKNLNIDAIYIAMPSASNSDRRDIISICQETGCELKILPGMYQFAKGDIKLANMTNVDVKDLLGRDPIKVNTEEILESLRDKVILVTGGGGSIGSELCRQIASHEPKQLVIFDIYENNAYEIQQELKFKYPELNLKVLIGSVRDTRRINHVFKTYRPEIVFHAAAHKHVPLMEDSPCEAIKNNVQGTFKTAQAAIKYKAKKFVLISTDKAVNPTNVMGASKRICEMIIQQMDRNYDETKFVAVRFGNVLGSNGSVIPLFKKQIERGGPVTVTHPDIIRYFMTIPEAVSLVLQASYYAEGGEIYVLDMGEPMKIDTLARNLIKLNGLKPDVDIPIVYTGLRPGEKLYEEKLMAEEGLKKTANELIHVGKPIDFDLDTIIPLHNELVNYCENNDEANVRAYIKVLVPTYQQVEEHQ